MKNAKKVLALVLSIVLMIPFLPILPAKAEADAKSTLDKIAASMDLGIAVSDELFGYDFAELTSVPSSFSSQAQGIQSITVNSETKNAFNVKSDSTPTVVMHPVSKSNFAAVMTFTVNPNKTSNGTISFGISDKDKNKAAIWGIGLPKRTQTTPAAGKSMITDNKNYSYPEAGAYEYSTTENFTVEMVIFFYEGVFYAYWPDGTLVGSIAARDTVDLSGGVHLYLEAYYGWSYIHDLYVYELVEKAEEIPAQQESLIEIAGTTGFIPGKAIANYDFNKLNSVPSSFIGQAQGIQSITVDSETKNAFNVKSDTSPTTVLHPVSVNNFAAVMTFTVDPNKTSNGTFCFGISDKNKNKAAIWGIGLPKRTQTTPAAGNSMITDNSKYNYPEAGAYEYSTTQNFTLQMIIYFYEGVFYAYWPDGTLVGSIAARNTVDLSGGIYLYLEAYYGWSYIHDLYICEITKGKIQTPLDKIAASMDLGIAVGEEIAGYDFTSGEYTAVPNSFNNTTLPIESIAVNSKTKKALRIKSDSSPTIATHAIGTNNFAAVMSVTINPNQTSSGIFSFGVSDKNKTKAAIWGIGLPKRTQTAPTAGNSMITDNSKYNYPSSGAYEYSTIENFTLEMAIFFYEGTFYAYWLDGTFVGSIAARASVDLSGGPYLYLEANYGWAYIHDLYVYEISQENENLPGVAITELEGKYKTQGRAPIVGNALMLDWSASGIEWTANCSGDVTVTLNATRMEHTDVDADGGLYFTVFVDGVMQAADLRMPKTVNSSWTSNSTGYPFHITKKGNTTFTIATDLEPGNHTFAIYNQTEANMGAFGIKSIELNGTFLDAPGDNELFVEFVGDSITASQGVLNNFDENAPLYEDATRGWPYLTAKKLNADWSIIAQSGITAIDGIGWAGSGSVNMQDVYPFETYYSNNKAHDFENSREPDVIVLGLGTNDACTWGSDRGNLTEAQKVSGFKQMLTHLRDRNPNAKIVWIYGMMTSSANSQILKAVSEMGGEANDYYTLELPQNTAGGRGHPNLAAQTIYAEKLSAFIESIAIKAKSPLVENSGFIADEVLYDMDFSTLSAGSTPDGWSFSNANITTNTGEAASRNVLRLANDTGSVSATYKLPAKNFAAKITVGIDYAQKLSGTFMFGVKDADGVNASYWGLGLPKRSESQMLKAGKSCINKGSGTYDYKYPEEGAYSYNVDGYTTLKMIMYLYEGTFYYFWEDGTLVGSVNANSECDLSKGDLSLYFANDWGRVYVHDLKIYEIIPNTFKVDNASLKLNNNDPIVNFKLSYDNSLKNVIDTNGMEFGAVVTINDDAVTTNTTIHTEDATVWEFENINNADDEVELVKEIPATSDILDKYINVRLFVKKSGMYNYAQAVSYCPAQLADVFYRSTQNSAEKSTIENIFGSSDIFLGKNSKKTTFTVFSDFHYKQGMYRTSIADMNAIMDRAYETGSSFVLSGGDMCNDFSGSPELVNAFKNNKYGLTVANVYGNHELESSGNSMAVVTPTLTNANNVVWGTANGSFDSNIGYYYFEKDGFRIVCTDTNYSWNETNGIWEHNKTASWGPPSGNTKPNALGDVQMKWLSDVLYDAADKDIPCIVVCHATFMHKWGGQSADAIAVQELMEEVNRYQPGTIMMQISGHDHDDYREVVNGILYYRINTTRNFWNANNPDHYGEDDVFMMETYDPNGVFSGYEKKLLGDLVGGKETYFHADPLSAVITVDECGIITIDGYESHYVNDINPDLSDQNAYVRPYIEDYSSFSCENGHIWDYHYDEFGNIVYDECMNPNCSLAILNCEEVYKVSNYVYDNESYKITFNYSANSLVKLGFFVADKDNAATIGYIGDKNVAIFTANGDGKAEVLLTVDKKGGEIGAMGESLYMYVIDGDASDIEIGKMTYKKLTNASGGSLITNKGVSILDGVDESESQAMRYYFSYDTTNGGDLLIDGKSYVIKSRGFLLANGDVLGNELVTRETAKYDNIIDTNIVQNFSNCWNVDTNKDILSSANLWFSTYVKGFDSVDGTYNNTKRLYVKGYVVVEADGVEYTLYGHQINATVSEVASLMGGSNDEPSDTPADTEKVTGKNRTLVWSDEFNNEGSLGDMWAFYNSSPSDTATYSKSKDNVIVKDGILTLRNTDDGDGTYTKPYDVVSKDTMAFKYGYLEIRAQVPYRKGLFPAFWLTPAQDLKESEYNGEVDIFEVFGSTDTSTTTMHIWDQDWNLINSSYESSSKREHTFSWFETTFGGVKAEGWHTYGFEWTESYMKFYVDGDCYYTADITDSNASNWGVDTLDCFRDYYTIILNNGLYEDTVKKNGLGSSYVDFNIDYVRLYQLQNGEYINNYEF